MEKFVIRNQNNLAIKTRPTVLVYSHNNKTCRNIIVIMIIVIIIIIIIVIQE